LINVQPEENCRIDENALLLRCEGSCVQSNENVQVLMAKKWSENGPKMVRKWSENGPKMVRKWSENGPKMVRKWSEFRTNSEQLLSVFSKVESVELLCCSDVEVLVCKAVKKCSSVGGRKKIGVD
jgi:hypothetical protein